MNEFKLADDEFELLEKLESGAYESVLTEERRVELEAAAVITDYPPTSLTPNSYQCQQYDLAHGD